MLTAQDFVEVPDSCPSCGDRISVDVDNDDEGFCHECGFEWKVERRFVGYSYEDEDGHHEVVIPDPAEECARLRAILERLSFLVPPETRDAGSLDIESITATANEARSALGEE